MRRLRYGVVGTGHRASTWIQGILAHPEAAELVAMLDPNPHRLAVHAADVARAGAQTPSLGSPDALERIVGQERLDRVVVTSPDHTHADIVVQALEAGADVVVEKPLTTGVEGVRRIAAAQARTGREARVAFNYRYSPRNAALRALLAGGGVGRVLSVHFEWLLDTAHGADYFRRWHRDKANSAGLLVHKASHHMDLVGWWLHAAPVSVFAHGGVRFYGDDGAGRPDGQRPVRGSDDTAAGDPWSLDLRSDPRLRALYLDAETADGYRRDQDPFAPGVTTEDTLSLVVEWAPLGPASGPGSSGAGVTMSYSLTAHSPWEGYRVAVNGTRGRAELDVVERSWVPAGGGVLDPSATGTGAAGDALRPQGARLLVQRHWEPAREVAIDGSGPAGEAGESGEGGHGGGDDRLLRDVVVGGALGRPAADEDPLGMAADWRDGVRAVAVGLAGNLSLEHRRLVTIAELDLGVDLDSA